MTIDIGCVDMGTLQRFAERNGVEFVEGDAAASAANYERWVAANVPVMKQAACDNCKGDSSVDDECCPYCGVGGFDAMTPAVTVSQPVPEPTKPKKGKGKKRSEAVEPEPAPEPAANEQPVLEPAPEVEAEAEPAKPKKGKGKKARPEPEPDPAPDPDPEPDAILTEADIAPREPEDAQAEVLGEHGGAEIVVRDGAMTDLLSEQVERLAAAQDVDSAIAAVDSAKRLAVVGYWHLGQAILRCFEGDLWKQARNDKGNPKHKSFGSFCEIELRLSARYCYTLMEVSSQFSNNDVSQIGVAKLGQILKVPPAQRAKLLEEARGGKPLSKLAEQVKKITAKDGTSGAGAGKRDTSKGREASAAKVRAERVDPDTIVTCTHELKRHRVELFCKGAKGDEPKRAKRLADEPVGAELSMNGVTIRYTLTKDTKEQLVLIVERVRPDKGK